MATTIAKDFTRQLVGDDKVSCIIYAQTKVDTEKIASHLKSIGIHAHAYHAGLGANERSYVHQGFVHDRIRVVVATVAFGMGIDNAEVRKVINWGLVKNLESLVQMQGRAGRDGQPAECVMIYSKADYGRSSFIANSRANQSTIPQSHMQPEDERIRQMTISTALAQV